MDTITPDSSELTKTPDFGHDFSAMAKALESYHADPLSSLTHNSPETGKFIVAAKSWHAQTDALMQGNLYFDVTAYAHFDGVIAETCSSFDINDEYYATLRYNLAVIRNFLTAHCFPDGFRKSKHIKESLSLLADCAQHIGALLYNAADDQSVMDYLNISGYGAAYIYSYVLETMPHTKAPQGFLGKLFGASAEAPHLPLLENTPFTHFDDEPDTQQSDNNQDDGATQIDQNYVDEVYAAEQIDYAELLRQNAMLSGELVEIEGEEIEQEPDEVPVQLANVEDLKSTIKERAIQIAHDILDNLRVLFADVPIKQLLDMADQPIVRELFTDLNKVADTFGHHLNIAAKMDPDLLNDLAVLEASEAFGIFSYQSALNEIAQLQMRALSMEASGDRQTAAELRAKMEKLAEQARDMPDQYKQESGLTVSGLLDKIEAGLDKVVDRMQDLTQGQNQLGIANELMLGNKQVESPDANKEQSKEKEKGPNQQELDKKFDAAMAARQAALTRQREAKQRMDEKTGKDSEQTARRADRRNRKMTVSGNLAKMQALQKQQAEALARQTAQAKEMRFEGLDDVMNAVRNAVSLEGVSGSGDALKPFSAKDMAKSIAKKGVQADRASDAIKNLQQAEQQAEAQATAAAQKNNHNKRGR